jgi:hypothetical protein
MSLASYFTTKKKLKQSTNNQKEDVKKKKDDSNQKSTTCTTETDIQNEVEHEEVTSPTKNKRNYGEEDNQKEMKIGFQFNFDNNVSITKEQNNDETKGGKNDYHNFQFGFQIDNDDNERISAKMKKKKRKKRKKKSHSSNKDQEGISHDDKFNDNDVEATNNRDRIMKPQHKETQQNQEWDDEEEDDELNFEAMQSFVQSSRLFNHDISSNKEKQNQEYQEPKIIKKISYNQII